MTARCEVTLTTGTSQKTFCCIGSENTGQFLQFAIIAKMEKSDSERKFQFKAVPSERFIIPSITLLYLQELTKRHQGPN